jgi:hypothetical protein
MSSLSAVYNPVQNLLFTRFRSAFENLPTAERLKQTSPEARALVDAANAYKLDFQNLLRFPDDRSEPAVSAYKDFLGEVSRALDDSALNPKKTAHLGDFEMRLQKKELEIALSAPDVCITVSNLVNTADAFIESQVRSRKTLPQAGLRRVP